MPSIKKNYIYNLCYQILTIIIPLITTPYISRVLGAKNIGINSYTNSIETYFLLFAALGTSFYGRREIAMHRDNKKETSQIFWEIECLSILSALLCLIAWIAFVLSQKEFTTYYWVLSINIVSVAFDITWLFIGLEQFKRIVKRNIFIKLISVILTFSCVHGENGLFVYMLINAGASLLGNISMWYYLRQIVEPFGRRKLSIAKHFNQTIIYFLPTIATTIYTVLDKTMLQVITSDLYENGYYEQATKICRIPMTLLLSMDTVMGARMSYLLGNGEQEEVQKRLGRSLQFVAFLGIPLVIGIDAIIRQLVPWFLGKGYEDVIPLVYLYSPLILCIGINNCLSEQFLTPDGQRKKTAIVVFCSAAMNFILNLILIPGFHANGAAIASVISEGFIALTYMMMCKKVIPLKRYLKYSWRNLISAMVMTILIYYITQSWKPTILCTLAQILCGAFIYFVVLFLLQDTFLRKQISIITSKIPCGKQPGKRD